MIQQREQPSTNAGGGADRCRPQRLRGGSTLTLLAAIATTALMAIVSRFALLAPHERLFDTLEKLAEPIAGVRPVARPFGACGDICSDGHGGCRHVVLRDGLHKGGRVSDAVLAAAEACH